MTKRDAKRKKGGKTFEAEVLIEEANRSGATNINLNSLGLTTLPGMQFSQ